MTVKSASIIPERTRRRSTKDMLRSLKYVLLLQRFSERALLKNDHADRLRIFSFQPQEGDR